VRHFRRERHEYEFGSSGSDVGDFDGAHPRRSLPAVKYWKRTLLRDGTLGKRRFFDTEANDAAMYNSQCRSH
jgi:hypothetical protein